MCYQIVELELFCKRLTRVGEYEMKRIIYKCRKINSGMKKWLNSNKIYFETVVMLILSITGIIISYMGVSVSKTANKLSYQANCC